MSQSMEWIRATGINRYGNTEIKWLGEMCGTYWHPCVYSIYTNYKQTENMHHCDHTYNGNHIFTYNFIQIYSAVKGFHWITDSYFLQMFSNSCDWFSSHRLEFVAFLTCVVHMTTFFLGQKLIKQKWVMIKLSEFWAERKWILKTLQVGILIVLREWKQKATRKGYKYSQISLITWNPQNKEN